VPNGVSAWLLLLLLMLQKFQSRRSIPRDELSLLALGAAR